MAASAQHQSVEWSEWLIRFHHPAKVTQIVFAASEHPFLAPSCLSPPLASLISRCGAPPTNEDHFQIPLLIIIPPFAPTAAAATAAL